MWPVRLTVAAVVYPEPLAGKPVLPSNLIALLPGARENNNELI